MNFIWPYCVPASALTAAVTRLLPLGLLVKISKKPADKQDQGRTHRGYQ
jgi:hypothetical protein